MVPGNTFQAWHLHVLWQKQESQKVIEERREAGMNDYDLQELLKQHCHNRIQRNHEDRDFWLRDLSKSGRWTRELNDAIIRHFSILQDAIILAFKEVLPLKL